MATALVNSVRRYRFQHLNHVEQADLNDNEFSVQYIGCTAISEDYETASDQEINDFFDIVVNSYQSNADSFRLTVDGNGATLRDSDGSINRFFKACNISYVTTTNSWRKYAKYVILVARIENEKSLKGHVLLCQSKFHAKRMCSTFTKMFKNAISTSEHSDESVFRGQFVTKEFATVSYDLNRNDTKRFYDIEGMPNTKCNASEVDGRQVEEERQEQLNDNDDAFTELAKSRSVNSRSSASNDVTECPNHSPTYPFSEVFN